MERFAVTRMIGIDAGHRVMTHGSKCRALHGHRYQIEAACTAENAHLHDDGEQTDMVIDFGFLKQEMERLIDAPCDHGLILSVKDDALLTLFTPENTQGELWRMEVAQAVKNHGYYATNAALHGTKLYVISRQPTAECLAEHWFKRLAPAVSERSEGVAKLARLRVWETPNCYADYWADHDAF